MTVPAPSISRTLGPKDWIPRDPLWARPGTDFLTNEERERLQALRKMAGAGVLTGPDDVKWLCRTLDRIATYRKIDDYVFPEYVGLVNYISNMSYALRFDKRHDFRQDAVVLGHLSILEKLISAQPCDAYFMVRPVVEILKGDIDDIGKFMDATLVMKFDGSEAVRGEFRRHTLPFDGVPFTFDNSIPKATLSLGVSPMEYSVSGSMWETNARVNLGLFLPNGTLVEIVVMDLRPLSEPVVVRTSLLGAFYTTRAAGQATA